MSDMIEMLEKLESQIYALQEHLDLASKQSQLDLLRKEAESPTLWDDPISAQSLMKKIASLERDVSTWVSINDKAVGLKELIEIDDGSFSDEISRQLDQLQKELDQKEIDLLLSGEYDEGNALLTIHAGAGGTDSQDWAEMLERMYLRWADSQGFKTEILDLSPGEECGIKSVTISVEGQFAYGYLSQEIGVHRLVRLSPFDSAHRRHTSFALVEVLPEIEDNAEIIIRPEDITIEVYKSSGAGGQNVQKNMTAVRIIHHETGLVVTCQNERSQTQNRESALKVLRSRLFRMQEEERADTVSELKGEFKKMEWGNQIRSYVLHPYQMVKDHRTDYETGNTQAVLDGDISAFIEASLKHKAQ
ncbi:MAG TPA: peptide chain release factor 2 [Anaerolineaceae bacterium]|nr:peptide chain release factor 2 [Anaerolineaceae bacterium]